jgi:beta-lactamase superfamily II metal-dependent hydrolase
MFRIEMLPAAHGDSLWITYGSPDAPRHILIDGGMRYTYQHLRDRILTLPSGDRRLELLIITHIDADHIEGCIRLLQDEMLGLDIREIWFNGQPQLDGLPDPANDQLGPEQGEFLGALIRQYEQSSGSPVWNTSFEGKAVMVPDTGDLPCRDFSGLKLTVISPGLDQLFTLKDEWDTVMEDAGFESGNVQEALQKLAQRTDLAAPDVLGGEEESEDSEFDQASSIGGFADVLGESEAAFGSDSSPANGSSIAVIAEWEGKRYLLCGDAYAPVMAAGVGRWLAQATTAAGSPVQSLDLELFKLAHHGSVSNISEELLALIKCRRYLFSTSGKIFGHPHDRTVELILEKHQARGKPQLYFNYRTGRTERWADVADQAARRYEAYFPTGLAVKFAG